jgi:hypothetical protein
LNGLFQKRIYRFQGSLPTGIQNVPLEGRPRTYPLADIHDHAREVSDGIRRVGAAIFQAYRDKRDMKVARDEALAEVKSRLREHGIHLEGEIVGFDIKAQEGRTPDPYGAEVMTLRFTFFRIRGHFAVPTVSGQQGEVAYIAPFPGSGNPRPAPDQPALLFMPDVRDALKKVADQASEADVDRFARAMANQEVQRQLLLEAGLKPQTPEHQTLIWLAALTGETNSALRVLEVMVHSSKDAGSDDIAQDFILENLASLHHIVATQPQAVLAYYQKHPKELRADAIEIRADTLSRLRGSGLRGKVDFVVDEG